MVPLNCAAGGLSAEPPCLWNVSTLAGSGSSLPTATNGLGSAATFDGPSGVAVASSSRILYVADTYNNIIRSVTPEGLVGTLAGNGTPACIDGVGVIACFYQPAAVAVHPISGDIYCADASNNRLRRITSAGFTSTFSGNGPATWVDGNSSEASFWNPLALAIDSSGTVFVADTYNQRIRRVSPFGSVTTLAGNGSVAIFSNPSGIALDGLGYVVVSDTNNNRVRRVSPGGLVSTLAGSGSPGWGNGVGTAATFAGPHHLAFTANGNLLVVDSFNGLVRMVTPLGAVSTVAGVGSNISTSFSEGIGTAASFFYPTGVATYPNGTVAIGDSSNNRLRSLVCTLCPAAYACDTGTPVLCSPGFFCPPGAFSAQPCPVGTFSAAAGAILPGACQPCPCPSACTQPNLTAPASCSPTPTPTPSISTGASPSATPSPSPSPSPTLSPSASQQPLGGAPGAASSAPPATAWDRFVALQAEWIVVALETMFGLVCFILSYMCVVDALLSAFAPGLHAWLWRLVAACLTLGLAPLCCCQAGRRAALSRAATIYAHLDALRAARRSESMIAQQLQQGLPPELPPGAAAGAAKSPTSRLLSLSAAPLPGAAALSLASSLCSLCAALAPGLHAWGLRCLATAILRGCVPLCCCQLGRRLALVRAASLYAHLEALRASRREVSRITQQLQEGEVPAPGGAGAAAAAAAAAGAAGAAAAGSSRRLPAALLSSSAEPAAATAAAAVVPVPPPPPAQRSSGWGLFSRPVLATSTPGPSAAPGAAAAAAAAAAAEPFVTLNPVASLAGRGRPAAAEEAGSGSWAEGGAAAALLPTGDSAAQEAPPEVDAQGWQRHEDSGDVWYHNAATGETTWVLPAPAGTDAQTAALGQQP